MKKMLPFCLIVIDCFCHVKNDHLPLGLGTGAGSGQNKTERTCDKRQLLYNITNITDQPSTFIEINYFFAPSSKTKL